MCTSICLHDIDLGNLHIRIMIRYACSRYPFKQTYITGDIMLQLSQFLQYVRHLLSMSHSDTLLPMEQSQDEQRVCNTAQWIYCAPGHLSLKSPI